MADKEERILITKVSSHCHALRFSCDPFDDEEGLFCDKNGQYVRVTEKDCAKCKNPVFAGISRAEAVERMGYAMCKQKHRISDCADCEDASVGMCDLLIYHLRAIAALDALLRGKNG